MEDFMKYLFIFVVVTIFFLTQAAGQTLTLAQAKEVLAAAEQKASELGAPVSIAVMDVGGNLIAFERMDGSLLGSVDGAMMKAYTSVLTGGATKDIVAAVQPGQPLYQLSIARFSKPTIFLEGGVPLRMGEVLVGAVGVGGASLEQDQQIAEAALAVMTE
jgi:uncharacterized protein GlcG (DUF336 family)